MVYHFKVLFQYILVKNSSIKPPRTARYLTLTFIMGSWDLHLELTEFRDPLCQRDARQFPFKFCKSVGQILAFSSNLTSLNCSILRFYKHRGQVVKTSNACVFRCALAWVWPEDNLRCHPQECHTSVRRSFWPEAHPLVGHRSSCPHLSSWDEVNGIMPGFWHGGLKMELRPSYLWGQSFSYWPIFLAPKCNYWETLKY